MRQERAELTRHALTMAAAKSFDRSGYQRTTLFEVSRAAAMSKGALSFHFGSKEELADTVRREACTRAFQATELLRAKDQPALQTLIDLTHLVAEQLTHDHLARAAVKLAWELETPPDPEVNPMACWRQVFGDVAREAEKDGALRRGTTAETVAEVAFCLASAASSGQPGEEGDPHQRLADQWQVLLYGMVSHPEPAHLWIAGTESDWLRVSGCELQRTE
jgi:AcrR family transcriptional regulator